MFCWKSTGIIYSGALEFDIDFVEKRIGINLPKQYVELIKKTQWRLRKSQGVCV